MNNIEIIKKCFSAAVKQGLGKWIDDISDSDLGVGIFMSTLNPKLCIFEKGLMSGDNFGVKIKFEDMVELDFLDLRSLMQAQKNPNEPVEFFVKNKDGVFSIQAHLYCYTELVGMLNEVVRVS